MDLLNETALYLRFARGLVDYFGKPLSLAEARRIIENRLSEREDSFLRLLERGIYGNPRSPYLPLLEMAQCEFGDIRTMVRAKGLERTLDNLRKSGVFVTFEEFKGRKAMVRNGQSFHVQPSDFDNPYSSFQYYTQTGGSTGRGTRVGQDLEHLSAQAPNLLLSYDAYDLLDAPLFFWFPPLPSSAGFNCVLRFARFGQFPRKWFAPLRYSEMDVPFKYRLATYGMVAISRLRGVPVPKPSYLPMSRADCLAELAHNTVKKEGKCVIRTGISMALRVCVAARTMGLSLDGVTFVAGGEPPTPAKVTEIRSTGARLFPTYFFTETGLVGMGCQQPEDENDIHLFSDIVALIRAVRRVPGTDYPIKAFLFTSLLPTAPKLLLNVESDDYGEMVEKRCSCPLGSIGHGIHLRGIRSFRKLTGESVTLVGSEMISIIEELLPSRFGGSALDYQLSEEEGENGFTQLVLRVNPSLPIGSDHVIVETVLNALRPQGPAPEFARAVWSQAHALKVKREAPIWTARGKLMPLHLQKVSRREDNENR